MLTSIVILSDAILHQPNWKIISTFSDLSNKTLWDGLRAKMGFTNNQPE